MKTRSMSLAALAMFAVACADPAGPVERTLVTSPSLFVTPISIPHDGADPEVGVWGTVELCKQSNVAGSFSFNISENGTADLLVASPLVIVIEGNGGTVCVDVYRSTAGHITNPAETVTITETTAATLTAISITQYLQGPPDGPDPYRDDELSDTPAPYQAGDVTATLRINSDMARRVTFTNTAPAAGAVLLIIDEDGIDNGLHFNAAGGLITPRGPNFFSVSGVNDDRPSKTQRSVLRYFGAAENLGRTITVKTGQTGDEGWFAPNCIPKKFIATNYKEDNTCMTNGTRATGIDNYFGKNGSSAIPAQERLDKVPHVIPLRALGLNALIGRTVCAVVYDSDVSINYDHDKPLGVNGNLQGETLGIVAFDVNLVRTLDGFSSSTLPQVTITIRSTSVCGNWVLFNAPVPNSSSVPNDRVAPGSASGYKALKVWPGLELFY